MWNIHTFYWINFSQIIVLNNNSNELFDYGMGIRSRRQKIFDKNELYISFNGIYVTDHYNP